MKVKRKRYKTLLSFLVLLCCLSEGPTLITFGGAVPRVVFENESDGGADLSVGKEVENAEGYIADADDRFTFILALSRDGEEVVGRQAYRLCDLSGEELPKEQGGGALIFTEDGGRFSLKAGQLARFPNIPAGTDYVIRELSKAGYTQLFPEGGNAKSGTKEDRTETVIFKNLYNPGGRGEARLEIVKTVAFPEGYSMPETPDFAFELKLGGRLASGILYKVLDNITDRPVDEQERRTGQDGIFTLKGGQKAIFGGRDEKEARCVLPGSDYEIRELALPSGWRLVGGDVPRRGGVNGTTTERFHNSEASFAVTKRMEDYSTPDVDFCFELKKADGALWSGAAYYLCEAGGAQRTSEAPRLHRTEADGTFTLKPGQAAVFTGIEPGTGYSVREVGNPEYIQILPLQTEGYMNREVETTVRTLPFVNRKEEYSRLLTVTTAVVNKKGDAADASSGGAFHFILSRKAADGNWKPVEHALYSVTVGNAGSTYYTGAGGEKAGEFILKANETARFQSLSPGDYQVEEIALPPGYEISDGEDMRGEPFLDISGGSSPGTVRKTLEATGHAAFVFTHNYWSDKVDLCIRKTNLSGDAPLEGVKFRLLKAEENGWENRIEVGVDETDSEGRIFFNVPLTAGIWYVEETKTLTGYRSMAGPLKIEIGRREDGLPLPPTITCADGVLLSPEEEASADALATYAFVPGAQARDRLTLTIKNEFPYDLPGTGGPGVIPYTLAGIALATAAVFCMRVRF